MSLRAKRGSRLMGARGGKILSKNSDIMFSNKSRLNPVQSRTGSNQGWVGTTTRNRTPSNSPRSTTTSSSSFSSLSRETFPLSGPSELGSVDQSSRGCHCPSQVAPAPDRTGPSPARAALPRQSSSLSKLSAVGGSLQLVEVLNKLS